MKIYNSNAQQLLLRIMELSEKTAPVKISLGYVSGDGQCRKGIVIRDAPSAVIKEVINDERVLTSSLNFDGLHIEAKPN